MMWRIWWGRFKSVITDTDESVVDVATIGADHSASHVPLATRAPRARFGHRLAHRAVVDRRPQNGPTS